MNRPDHKTTNKSDNPQNRNKKAARPKKTVKNKKCLFQYNSQNMKDAVDAVRSGKMSMKSAAKTFEVPRTSLIRKVRGEVPLVTKMGPQTILTKEEEEMLEFYILSMSKKGFPVHRDNILDSVGKLMKETERENAFPNGRPGLTWFKAFLQRHPKISEKEAESLTKSRAAVSEEGVRSWFEQVSNYFEEEGLSPILNDATRIFNADETGFMLCPKTGKVLCEKGDRYCYKQVQNNEKEQLTVMCAFSADGKKVPPTLVFPYKRKLPRTIAEEVPDGWGTGISSSGWMNSEVFYGYIANSFIPYLEKENIKLPVVLFVDGYKSHITLQVSELCSENQIILIALHPNSTHFLQPADVSVFGPLKKNWKQVVRQWQYENYPKSMTRQTFAKVFQIALENVTEESIQNGFRTCGIFPFTADNINFDKLIKARTTSSNQNLLDHTKATEDSSNNQKQTPNAGKILSEVEKFIEEDRLIMFEEVFATKNEWFEERPNEVRAAELYEVWRALKNEAICEHTMKNTSMMTTCENSQPELYDSSKNKDNEQPNSNISSPIEASNVLLFNDPIIINVPSFMNNTEEVEHVSGEIDYPLNDFEDLGNVSLGFEDIEDLTSAGCSISQNYEIVNNIEPSASTSKNLGEHKKKYANVSPFKKCLVWPKTPPKKDLVGSTRRKLFPVQKIILSSDPTLGQSIPLARNNLDKTSKWKKVVSSEKWKDHYKKEEEMKLQKEAARNNKKKRRKSSSEDDWVCKECSASWKQENKEKLGLKWVNCDICKSAFHFRCIPRRHRINFGLENDSEGEGNVDFECHYCAPSDDSDLD